MYEYTIRLSFDAKRQHEQDINRFLELRQAVHAEMSAALAALDRPQSPEFPDQYALTPATCRAIGELLVKVRGHEVAELSSARVIVALDADAAERAEWFVVWPQEWQDVDGSDGALVGIRADRVKGRQPLRRYSEVPLVSEKWVAFVRDAGLRGVEFLWARDKGKYAATQWYTPIGTAFLGRGIDHPWFDPSTRGAYRREGFMVVQPTDPAWVLGVRTFEARQARAGLSTDPPELAALLAELGRTPARYAAEVVTPPCVLRPFLPDADFAYLRVAQPHEPGDRAHRTVRLCASASARKRLLEARLAEPGDFLPVEVADAPPPGVPVFDARDGAAPPPGVLAGPALAKARAKVAKQRAAFDAKPKPPMPVKSPPIAKLAAKLKRRIKQDGGEVARGAAADAIAAAGQKVGIAVPARWAELLATVDGFVIDNCYALDGTAELRVASASDLPEEHAGNRSMIGSGDPDLPPTHLGVASSDIGDAVFLDTARLTADGDCPVLFVNHETLETEMTWPAIGVFLSDALEPPGDD